MKRYLLVAAAALAALASAHAAAAATLCVGPHSGCFAQIQPAVAAAHDGDTITIAPGTFAGGITIDKSLQIKGTSAGATTIAGGGPVLKIFRATASDGLNVSIDRVTITGGLNTSVPDHAVTFGGGVAIPNSQLDHPPFNGTGATVSISNSVITGNTVTSTDVIPPGFCGPRPCAFNSGGGIDNGGVLTLTNTQVTNNIAGSTASLVSTASDASSGGITTHFASSLVLRNSSVSGNHVLVDGAIANHADSGGIGSNGGLDVADSVISNNTVSYTGSLDVEDQAGLAGGLSIDQFIVPHPMPTIRNTRITGNSVTAANTNPNSTPSGFGGGVVAFVPALLERVTLSGNSVELTSAGFAGVDGGGLEIDAPVTMRDSFVGQNSVRATGNRGAIAFGGGIAMFGADLTLEGTVVVANSAVGNGAAAPLPFGGVSSVFGGGISNGAPGIPQATLTMTNSVVNANRLSASPGFLVQGGGVFSPNGIAGSHNVVAGNKPDNCFGC